EAGPYAVSIATSTCFAFDFFLAEVFFLLPFSGAIRDSPSRRNTVGSWVSTCDSALYDLLSVGYTRALVSSMERMNIRGGLQ
ncbi:Hypothetical predicted protein, partial [Olea europaea subsp. europaea]